MPLALVFGPGLKNLLVNPNSVASIFSDCDQHLSTSYHDSVTQHLHAKIRTIGLLIVDVRSAGAESVPGLRARKPRSQCSQETWTSAAQQLFKLIYQAS